MLTEFPDLFFSLINHLKIYEKYILYFVHVNSRYFWWTIQEHILNISVSHSKSVHNFLYNFFYWLPIKILQNKKKCSFITVYQVHLFQFFLRIYLVKVLLSELEWLFKTLESGHCSNENRMVGLLCNLRRRGGNDKITKQ